MLILYAPWLKSNGRALKNRTDFIAKEFPRAEISRSSSGVNSLKAVQEANLPTDAKLRIRFGPVPTQLPGNVSVKAVVIKEAQDENNLGT
jgi:hypothetical protein